MRVRFSSRPGIGMILYCMGISLRGFRCQSFHPEKGMAAA